MNLVSTLQGGGKRGYRVDAETAAGAFTFDWQMSGSGDESWRGKSRAWMDDAPGRARALGVTKTLAVFPGVRRLTPIECERLQGFPDGWTEGESDSTRYRMLGNAVCVPVAEWIGRRMLAQDINLRTTDA